ncbi:hypothetical protein RND71_002987 [Anisodus tanguticus]|uniref:Uncharacterized protein n=1 Tax=Anisodus tanguticus TaxID=243964 RepID=A0AAE1VPK4_9SOLA|nr:hypothetical protein RND71_002983 [Anisodus tanguticus]KAK4376691.1 hypothetical protein RND71_002987 [Anisodus tanguticus]
MELLPDGLLKGIAIIGIVRCLVKYEERRNVPPSSLTLCPLWVQPWRLSRRKELKGQNFKMLLFVIPHILLTGCGSESVEELRFIPIINLQLKQIKDVIKESD